MSLEGQRLGEFEILERLGQGAMGAVYKARQASLDRLVALKTLQSAIAADPEYITRFRREAKAAAALSHQNLVQVYSAGENDGLNWFAMEYVEGESAQARLKRKERLDPTEAVAIGIHVASALEYGWRKAHLIHRDIKPDNIFLSGDGEVKLGDLGLAKSAGEAQSLTMTGSSMGTPHYISPEQGQGKKGLDLRSDIYSLGCTLFHLVAGKPPYFGDTAMAVMLQHVTEPVPNPQAVWPGFPSELARVVMKMMQKQPADRQQSYAEVIADLRRAHDALTGATVLMAAANQLAATQQPQPTASASPKRPLPIAALAGGALAVCVAMGSLLYFTPWKKGASSGTGASGKSSPSKAGVSSSGELLSATKDSPFVNSLGMKFVPVPGTKVFFSVWDTRVADYTAYARVHKEVDGGWATQTRDGVAVSREPEYPVVGVSWEDAQAFCRWLTEKEIGEGKLPKGMKYRLPTDEEWSVAVGLVNETGATPAAKQQKNKVDFPWGTDYPPTKKVGNYSDEAFHAKFPAKKAGNEDDEADVAKDTKAKNWLVGYNDGYATTSPVGSFPPNAYGLYDMGGNVWQWCEDWFDTSQQARVLRGASWGINDRGTLLSSNRNHYGAGNRNYGSGFRCVVGVSAR